MPSFLNHKFNANATAIGSHWGLHNGHANYDFNRTQQSDVIAHMISKALPTQKTFYLLDIGAGNFQWGRAMAAYLNEHFDNDITVNIISVRAETHDGPEKVVKENCVIYELGDFEAEQLASELTKRLGHSLEGKIDFAISSWCLLHITNPVDLVVQTYHALKPHTGLFMFDGFNISYQGIDGSYSPNPLRMTELLHNINAPFIFMPDDHEGRMNAMVIQKDSESKLNLPLVYSEIKSIEHGDGTGRIATLRLLSGWKRVNTRQVSLRKQYTRVHLEVDDLGVTEFLYLNEKGKQLLADLAPAFTYQARNMQLNLVRRFFFSCETSVFDVHGEQVPVSKELILHPTHQKGLDV